MRTVWKRGTRGEGSPQTDKGQDAGEDCVFLSASVAFPARLTAAPFRFPPAPSALPPASAPVFPHGLSVFRGGLRAVFPAPPSRFAGRRGGVLRVLRMPAEGGQEGIAAEGSVLVVDAPYAVAY